jgi:hypothetical protein
MSGRRNTAVPNRRVSNESIRTSAPNTSINSAQLFNSQAASGRLAGQHAALAQQQMQQQQFNQSTSTSNSTNVDGPSRMTIAQAITLITLRLGKVETQIYEILYQNSELGLGHTMNMNMDDGVENGNVMMIERGVLNSLLSRLDALESKSETSISSGPSTAEFTILKQNVETLKPALVQTKTALTNTAKEMKKQVDSFRNELNETKELLEALHAMTLENNQTILMMGMNSELLEEEAEMNEDSNISIINDEEVLEDDDLEQDVVENETTKIDDTEETLEVSS